MVEKENVIVRINPNNFIVCENKSLRVDENGLNNNNNKDLP
jgi:hypothetical protein